ncbi:16S rRNA (guanine(527)-N(7))-methyltransferase RsmG [Spongorhabdus nitratireducens]
MNNLQSQPVLEQRLRAGIAAMKLDLSEQAIAGLMQYLELLQKWNKAYNLTAIRDPEEMVTKHLLDSLSITGYIKEGRVLDVGTGPGLPGMILAIVRPDLNFTLLDCNGKKTRFLTQVKLTLGLDNVTVLNDRVEARPASERYDCITSRAFSALEDMIEWTEHLLDENGCWLAMKGVYPQDELAKVHQRWPDIKLETCDELRVPDCDGERHLVILRR